MRAMEGRVISRSFKHGRVSGFIVDKGDDEAIGVEELGKLEHGVYVALDRERYTHDMRFGIHDDFFVLPRNGNQVLCVCARKLILRMVPTFVSLRACLVNEMEVEVAEKVSSRPLLCLCGPEAMVGLFCSINFDLFIYIYLFRWLSWLGGQNKGNDKTTASFDSI